MSLVLQGSSYGAPLIQPARRSGSSGAAKRTAILSAKAAPGSYARDSPNTARETLSVLLDSGGTPTPEPGFTVNQANGGAAHQTQFGESRPRFVRRGFARSGTRTGERIVGFR
jgi:hypothetical protein